MKRPVAFIALAALAAGAAFAQDAIKAARGARRFTDIAALPVTDPGAQIHYEGSIDRGGYNGDYNWGTYQDKHGDWVLMETDKPAERERILATLEDAYKMVQEGYRRE